MIVSKHLTDDKKEKHSSIELTIAVPTISEYVLNSYNLYGYSTVTEVEYVFYFSTIEEANKGFEDFLNILAIEYNRHPSTFTIVEKV